MFNTSTNTTFFYFLLIIRYTLILSAKKNVDSSLETKVYANSDFHISILVDVLIEFDKKYHARIFSDTMARFLVEEEFWL